jgi:hypothetical protein
MKKIGVIAFLFILGVIFTGCVEIIPDFEISNFEIEPEEIKAGESVNIKITIKNTDKEMTPENKFKVGVRVKPSDGAKYWNIPEPEVIEKLNPNGVDYFEFHVESKSDTPVGESTFQVYISSLDTGKEITFLKNNEKKVYVKSITAQEETPGFESIFAIATLIAAAYLIRRKRE